jgi:histidyl-tRNA synthetase
LLDSLDNMKTGKKIGKPKGVRDFSAGDMEKREHAGRLISEIFENYGYKRILTPTFEYVELFQLKSGEEIQKHMYVFKDKKGEMLCLRPEATASVCRMFSGKLRSLPKPIRLYYHCPMFRYEEPQRGRYREFWQTGVELMGPGTPQSDAEVISVAVESLRKLGLEFELEIGHIGILKGLMRDLGIKDEIHCRIIACIDKDNLEELRKLVGSENDKILKKLISLKGKAGNVPLMTVQKKLSRYPNAVKPLSELQDILEYLNILDIEPALNLGIARGLEYYTGMVFEIRVAGLGAQNQICGGGRYDELIELFSGISVPAVGFAFGFDRVMEAMELQGIEIPKRQVDAVVAPVSEDAINDALRIASDLRKNFIVDLDLMNRKLGRILEYASDTCARYVVIVGRRDLEEGNVTVRDMGSGEQKIVKVGEIRDVLK